MISGTSQVGMLVVVEDTTQTGTAVSQLGGLAIFGDAVVAQQFQIFTAGVFGRCRSEHAGWTGHISAWRACSVRG